MEDAELLMRFEGCTLDKAAWTHRAHVRVGFLYARGRTYEAALGVMRDGIRALNESHGVDNDAEGGYHETITRAFLRLVKCAVDSDSYKDSDAFCAAHPELLNKRVLAEYYSDEVLWSEAARVGFVDADLNGLPRVGRG